MEFDTESGKAPAVQAGASGGHGEQKTLESAIKIATRELANDITFDQKILTNNITTKVPVLLLRHPIREYQHVGLHWLATLHDRKFNGILADEMGLGKTIQTIALLAHLAVEKEIWGPHLIVAPTSVLKNWELELKKWAPGFKTLVYYGSVEERKQRRRGWRSEDSFHVVVASYSIVVQDFRVFQLKRWHYLVLDEAQHIKNWRSQKWQQLICLNSSRRLLLTGTPLQNDLMELWSLMHFLMPDIFESHDDFKDWFSDPLSLAIQNGRVDKQSGLLSRLHEVLRPFMLRRLKSEVERQMPGKHEHVEKCPLSRRQQVLYDEFMRRRETQRLLKAGHYLGIMGILMQLRKVCNHPQLFEPRCPRTPLAVEALEIVVPGLVLLGLWAAVAGRRVGEWGFCSQLLPGILLWRRELCQLRAASACMPRREIVDPTFVDLTLPGDVGPVIVSCNVSSKIAVGAPPLSKRRRLQLGFAPVPLPRPMPRTGGNGATAADGAGSGPGLSEGTRAFFAGAKQQLAAANQSRRQHRERCVVAVDWLCREMALGGPLWGADGLNLLDMSCGSGPCAGSPTSRSRLLARQERPRCWPVPQSAGSSGSAPSSSSSAAAGHRDRTNAAAPAAMALGQGLSLRGGLRSWLRGGGGQKRGPEGELVGGKAESAHVAGGLAGSAAVRASASALQRLEWWRRRRRQEWWERDSAAAALCEAVHLELQRDARSRLCRWAVLVPRVVVCPQRPAVLVRAQEAPAQACSGTPSSTAGLHVRLTAFPLGELGQLAWLTRADAEETAAHREARRHSQRGEGATALLSACLACQLPEKHYLESDCGKLSRLRTLLRRFQDQGSKCIIFTQFSKMLDLLESFANYHRFTYVRLDGTVKVDKRQALVDSFNSDPRIFLFISSTRSGGVGINLIGANIVIFYDSDWNPAMDRQAMDRAHRIGQIRDVHIYRLLSEHTVEENIWQRQLQKRQLDDLVVDQGQFNTASLQGARGSKRGSLWTLSEVRAMLDVNGQGPTAAAAGGLKRVAFVV